MTKGSLPVFIKKMFAFLLISVLMLSLAAEAFAEIRIDTHFFPDLEGQTSAEIFLSDTAVWITMTDGETFLLLWEDIPDVISDFLDIDRASFNGLDVDEETLSALAERYGKIVMSVVGIFNLSRKKTDISLSAFDITQKCTVWSCTPSRKNWKKMLTKLFNTAAEDEQLAALLPEGGQELINMGKQNVDKIVDELDGLSAQIAYEDGKVYLVKLTRDDQAVCYQSYGNLSDIQHDAIVVGSGEEEIVFASAETSYVKASPPDSAHRVETSEDVLALFSALIPVMITVS